MSSIQNMKSSKTVSKIRVIGPLNLSGQYQRNDFSHLETNITQVPRLNNNNLLKQEYNKFKENKRLLTSSSLVPAQLKSHSNYHHVLDYQK
jgi:hypothetical protein